MARLFRDCQEWEWIPRRFDPGRALVVPRSVRAQIDVDPRVLEDAVWAKMMSAGLNLVPEDLHVGYGIDGKKRFCLYPFEMIRALVMVLLFAGLRCDEIRRLRLGCVRWQHTEAATQTPNEPAPEKDAVCWLDVPVNKTSSAFTKPVDGAMGKAVEAWQVVRPRQPSSVDPKTSEAVNFLFFYRGNRVGEQYLKDRIIPLLCRKAGVPESDVRGRITVHRIRATIASQLYNADDPLGLPDLQGWMGHSSPAATQHYAKITPTRLAKSYTDAEYFKRNLRMIEVLIDQEAVRNGTAANGEPWKYYDLGHGYCTYDFAHDCPHLMACAKCSFYVPKGSIKEQILEGKANLTRMREEIPLSDEEVAVADEGIELQDKLLERLADVPTPAGPTPRELGRRIPNESSASGSQAGEQPGTPLIPAESLLRKPPKENGDD